MKVKKWPKEWGNNIAIISVPFAEKDSKGRWMFKVFYIDLNDKRYENKSLMLPISIANSLKIGAVLATNFETVKESGEVKSISLDNLSNGKIIKLGELDFPFYGFNIINELKDETYLYSIDINGEQYLFFCFEIFRKFFLGSGFLNKYLFNPSDMNLLIDKSEVVNSRELNITFNVEVPIGVLSKVFVQQFVLVNYHTQFNSLLNNNIKYQANSLFKNNFHFYESEFKGLNLTCRIKQKNGINLVYEINEINGIGFPFEDVNLEHPKFIEANTNKSSKKRLIKKLEAESSEIILEEEAGYSPSKAPKTTFENKFSIRYDSVININRKKKLSADLKDTSQKLIIPEKMDNETLSTSGPDRESNMQQVNIESNIIQSNINLEEIPEGLILFAQSISKVATDMKIEYTYDLIELPGTSTCTIIEANVSRKLLVIKLETQPLIRILEVDSSGGKSFPTLIVRNDSEVDFNKLAGAICDCGCKWPIEWLGKEKILFKKIKHPYIYENRTFISTEEKNQFIIRTHKINIKYGLLSLYKNLI